MKINDKKDAVREKVWEKLRNFARPDSRFHWDFNEFIPDFQGSVKCNNKIRQLDVYNDAKCIFVTPDNCLELLREYAILDKKYLIVSTYGIERDFFLIEPGSVPEGEERLASTLDGMEYFGKRMSILDLKSYMKIELMFTGASMINLSGLRWGKGHGYFDLEWAMFRECNIVDKDTTIFAVVHDCQILDLDLEISKFDTIIDIIVSPKSTIKIKDKHPKPRKIYWDLLTKEQIERIPALSDLRNFMNPE